MLVAQVDADGLALLDAALADAAPPELRSMPAIQLLRKVRVQNYVPTEGGLRCRTNDDGLPRATQFISSPYDPEAHLALERATAAWIGYKVYLTETCEPETPNLITDVQTVLAPIADWDSLPLIHQGLAKRALLPDQLLVDSGYAMQIFWWPVGGTSALTSWARLEATNTGKLASTPASQPSTSESIREQQRAICPEGRTSVSWSPVIDNRRTQVIKIRFSEKTARGVRVSCGVSGRRRSIHDG